MALLLLLVVVVVVVVSVATGYGDIRDRNTITRVPSED